MEAVFDDLLNALTRRGVRNPVVRIERADGSVVFQGAAGRARPDIETPLAPTSRFHLASVTKTMTAALILQLVEAGRAGPQGLDADLASLEVFEPPILDRFTLRDGEAHARSITLRHLLDHTSGLLDAFADDPTRLGAAPGGLTSFLMSSADHSRRDWVAWDPERPDDPTAGVINFFLASGHAASGLHRPGAAFHYSDTGYMILALVAERLNGEPLHEGYRERLFSPLGLASTHLAYHDDPANLGPGRRPEAEVWAGDRPMLSDGVSLSCDWGGGGVVSTAADLIAFLRGLLAGRLFRSSATIAEMTRWTTPGGLAAPRTGIGLGLCRMRLHDIELWGRTGAWGARMVHHPESGLFLAGTINQMNGPADWHWDFIRAAIGAGYDR